MHAVTRQQRPAAAFVLMRMGVCMGVCMCMGMRTMVVCMRLVRAMLVLMSVVPELCLGEQKEKYHPHQQDHE